MTDILIVGGRAVTAAAALEAARAGAQSLITCKNAFIGGITVQV